MTFQVPRWKDREQLLLSFVRDLHDDPAAIYTLVWQPDFPCKVECVELASGTLLQIQAGNMLLHGPHLWGEAPMLFPGVTLAIRASGIPTHAILHFRRADV